jgi:nitrite reductase (NADH) small subunit
MPLVRLCSVSDLPPEGEAREFPLGGKTICVANLGARYAAMDNVCAHRGGPLGQGVVLDGKVVCPWHGWMFDPHTGVANDDPRCRVAVYPVQISGTDLLIEI